MDNSTLFWVSIPVTFAIGVLATLAAAPLREIVSRSAKSWYERIRLGAMLRDRRTYERIRASISNPSYAVAHVSEKLAVLLLLSMVFVLLMLIAVSFYLLALNLLFATEAGPMELRRLVLLSGGMLGGLLGNSLTSFCMVMRRLFTYCRGIRDIEAYRDKLRKKWPGESWYDEGGEYRYG